MEKVTIVDELSNLEKDFKKFILSKNLDDLLIKLNINDLISKDEDTIEEFGFCSEDYTDWDEFVYCISDEFVVMACIDAGEHIQIAIFTYGDIIELLIDLGLLTQVISNTSSIDTNHTSDNSVTKIHAKEKHCDLFKDFIRI